jgi:hypothetical protein
MSADGIEGLACFDRRLSGLGPWGDRPRFRPTLEERFGIHRAQLAHTSGGSATDEKMGLVWLNKRSHSVITFVFPV